MKQKVAIFIERLREGKVQTIDETLDPAFLDIDEKDIGFKSPIVLSGEAYLAEDWLIVRLKIETQATLVCAVCNDSFPFHLHIDDLTHQEPLENIRDSTYDLLPLIRETILLEVPFYPQCGFSECKNRKEIEKYIKKEPVKEPDKKINGHKPFQELL